MDSSKTVAQTDTPVRTARVFVNTRLSLQAVFFHVQNSWGCTERGLWFAA